MKAWGAEHAFGAQVMADVNVNGAVEAVGFSLYEMQLN